MSDVKPIAEWMAECGIGMTDLVAASALDDRILQAIVECRYTPSPDQRRRLAAALGVGLDDIAWGHKAPIAHIYGHGPQFGRSP
jgi:hypothetical protein